jgi:hypothetical protein
MKEKCKDNISTPNFLDHLKKFNDKENDYHTNKSKLLNIFKTTSLNIISLLKIIFIKEIDINMVNTNIENYIKIFETNELDDVQPIVEFIYYDINQDMVSEDMKNIELYNNNFKITACELDDIFKKIIDIKAYNYYNVANITTALHKNIEDKLDAIILQLNKFINNNDENASKLKEFTIKNKINLFNIILPYNNVKTEINDEYTDTNDIYEKKLKVIGGEGINEDIMINFDIIFLTKLSQIIYLLFQNFLYLNTIITKKTVKKQINTIKEFNKLKSIKELKEIDEIKKLTNIEDLFINFYNKSYYLPTFITYNDIKNNDIQLIIRKYYNIIIISILVLLIECFLIVLKTFNKYTKNQYLFTKLFNLLQDRSEYLKYLNTNYEQSRVLFQNIEMIIGNMLGYMIEHVNEIDVKNQTIISNIVSANDLNMIIYIFLYYSYHNIFDDTELLKKPLNPVIIPDISKIISKETNGTSQQEVKEVKSKDVKDVKSVKDVKDVKDVKGVKDVKDVKGVKDVKDVKSKDVKDGKNVSKKSLKESKKELKINKIKSYIEEDLYDKDLKKTVLKTTKNKQKIIDDTDLMKDVYNIKKTKSKKNTDDIFDEEKIISEIKDMDLQQKKIKSRSKKF